MADQNKLPLSPEFPPRLPFAPEEANFWREEIQESIRRQYRVLADRIEGLITVGVLADRPAADGSLRLYFATDDAPPTMYFDDGTWHAI